MASKLYTSVTIGVEKLVGRIFPLSILNRVKGVTTTLTALKLKVMTIGFLNRTFFRVVNENENTFDFATILYKENLTLKWLQVYNLPIILHWDGTI